MENTELHLKRPRLCAEALRSTSNAQRYWHDVTDVGYRLTPCDAECENRLCVASSHPGSSLESRNSMKLVKEVQLVCVIQIFIHFGSNLPNNPEGPESNWIGLGSDEHHQDTQTVSQAGSPSLNECNSMKCKGTTPYWQNPGKPSNMRQFPHPLLHACGMARSAQTCLSDRVGTGTKIRNHWNTLDKQRNSLNDVEAAELQTTGVDVHVRRDHSNHPNHQSLATFSFPSPLINHYLPPAPVHDYDLGLPFRLRVAACSIMKQRQTSLVPNDRTGHILESGWQSRLVRNRYQIQSSRI